MAQDPYSVVVPRKMSPPELAQALRLDWMGELQAIVGYEAHILATDDERVKQVLRHINDEERRHVGELEQLIFMLDPQEGQYVEQGKQKVQQQQSQNFQQPMQ